MRDHHVSIPFASDEESLLRAPKHHHPPKFAEPKIVRFWDTMRTNFNFIFLTCLAITVANIFSETVKDILRTNFTNLRDRVLVSGGIVVFFVLWATIVSMRSASNHSSRPGDPPPAQVPQSAPSFGRV